MEFDATRFVNGGNPLHSSAEMERQYVRIWAGRVIATETGHPYDWENRPWLRRIWDDPWPRKVVQKCTQVGLTTYSYSLALHRAALLGQTVIYTFPTKGDVSEFVKGRLDKVIDESPGLRALMQRANRRYGKGITDNVGIKHIGKGTIYFRGTQTASGAVSVPAHVLIHDELDLSDQAILATYRHRLDNLDPADMQIYELSNPTVEDYGINERYKESDGREWFVACACGWAGPLDYWDHTRNGTLDHLACTQCSRTLDPRRGRWVAERPGRDFHGYHISKLMRCIPGRPDLVLYLHQERTKARFNYIFTNMSLGLPSSEGSITLNETLLKHKCFRDPHALVDQATMFDGAWFMGVDQGDTLTVVLGTVHGDLYYVRYLARLIDPKRGSDAWDLLDKLMVRFKVELCVVDGLPNGNNAHDFAARHEGRVLLCYYSSNQRAERRVSTVAKEQIAARKPFGKQPKRGEEKEGAPEITINRTDSLDRTATALTEGRVQLPGQPGEPEQATYLLHCAANARMPVEDEDGNLTYVWKRKGKNDYFHATNYFVEAVEIARRLGRVSSLHVAPVTLIGIPLATGAAGEGRRR